MTLLEDDEEEGSSSHHNNNTTHSTSVAPGFLLSSMSFEDARQAVALRYSDNNANVSNISGMPSSGLQPARRVSGRTISSGSATSHNTVSAASMGYGDVYNSASTNNTTSGGSSNSGHPSSPVRHSSFTSSASGGGGGGAAGAGTPHYMNRRSKSRTSFYRR